MPKSQRFLMSLQLLMVAVVVVMREGGDPPTCTYPGQLGVEPVFRQEVALRKSRPLYETT